MRRRSSRIGRVAVQVGCLALVGVALVAAGCGNGSNSSVATTTVDSAAPSLAGVLIASSDLPGDAWFSRAGSTLNVGPCAVSSLSQATDSQFAAFTNRDPAVAENDPFSTLDFVDEVVYRFPSESAAESAFEEARAVAVSCKEDRQEADPSAGSLTQVERIPFEPPATQNGITGHSSFGKFYSNEELLLGLRTTVYIRRADQIVRLGFDRFGNVSTPAGNELATSSGSLAYAQDLLALISRADALLTLQGPGGSLHSIRDSGADRSRACGGSG